MPEEFGNAGQNWENIGWKVQVNFTEHCHIEQVEAVFDRGEARLRHWNRVAGLSPGRQ
jgi:hypothetical protein